MIQAERNRISRRDKKADKRKRGMRVSGSSVKFLAQLLRRNITTNKEA